MIDGKKVAKYRVTEEELTQMLPKDEGVSGVGRRGSWVHASVGT